MRLDKQLANFFYKGPNGNYFWLSRPYVVCFNYSSCRCCMKAATEDKFKNGYGYVSIKLSL